MGRYARRLAHAAGLLLFLAACSAPTGSLQITIAGLPAGESADITVTGPANYGIALTETTTLSGLAPGSYSVRAGTISVTAVTRAFEATITPGTVAVVADATAVVTVDYAPQGGTLAVAVGGLPPGIDADIAVTGPSGFSQDLTASTVLTDLEPGDYDANADPVSVGGNSYAPTVTGAPAEVSSATGAGIEVVYAVDPGSLAITIEGLPGGVNGDVTVTGSDGFSQHLTANTILTDLAPGLYHVRARTTQSTDAVVGDVFDVLTPPETAIEVTSNGTADLTIAYSARPGSGRLWIPHGSEGTLVATGYDRDLLTTSGTPAPTVTLDEDGEFTEALAVDGQGNLLMATYFANAIETYAAGNLAAGGSVTPMRVLTTTTLADMQGPFDIAFDTDDNLWVLGFDLGTLTRFTPTQVALGGAQTPEVVIDLGVGVAYVGMAFDADGNLWVVSQSDGTVLRLTPDQMAASGTPTPDVILSSDGSDALRSRDVAFDAAGNLWVASHELGSDPTLGRVEMYTPAQQQVSGPTLPAVILTSDGASLRDPDGLAFDNEGNLWVANEDGVTRTLERFTPAQIATTGNPTPEVVLDGFPNWDLGHFIFNPPPPGLPINAP